MLDNVLSVKSAHTPCCEAGCARSDCDYSFVRLVKCEHYGIIQGLSFSTFPFPSIDIEMFFNLESAPPTCT